MIEQTKWIGHIEIHLKSSDWKKYKDQEDAAYNNVILHVVWEDDVVIRNFLGETIPTLQLKNIVDVKLLNRCELFMTSKAWITCEKLIAQTPKINLHLFLDRLLIERLEQKTGKIDWMLQ